MNTILHVSLITSKDNTLLIKMMRSGLENDYGWDISFTMQLRPSIQFNSVYLYSAKLQQLSSQGTLNNMVQLKPIGIQFIIVIIIQ